MIAPPALAGDYDRPAGVPVRLPTLALGGDADRPGLLEVFEDMDGALFLSAGLEKAVVGHRERPTRCTNLLLAMTPADPRHSTPRAGRNNTMALQLDRQIGEAPVALAGRTGPVPATGRSS